MEIPGVPLYDRIGAGYDATRRPDPYITQRLIYHLNGQAGGNYLDVACGTGNYTLSLAKAGLKMAGIDQSSRMIDTARIKESAVSWYVGSAEALPFPDGAFAGAVCTLAIHHFPALQPAFQEIARVLGQGRFVLFTSTPDQMRGYWLNEYFPQMMARSAEQMPRLEAILQSLGKVGLRAIYTEPYEVREDLQDLFLYSGKHRPAVYLDPRIRAGSSSFASLADPHEVEHGCRRLAEDIECGRISEVIASYHHEEGDYLFVVAEQQ